MSHEIESDAEGRVKIVGESYGDPETEVTNLVTTGDWSCSCGESFATTDEALEHYREKNQ